MTVRITTLPNGLRVVSEYMPHVRTACIGVWTDVGARHETESESGLSHMLEHMAFKGTQLRSAQAIAEEIENVGGHMNAYTSREHTTYFTRVLKEDLPLAADILADILLNSAFDEKELVREKDVILQEIAQTNDTPDDLVFDMLQETAFPDQAMGRSILGTSERVRAFTRDDLVTYMSGHYRGEGMVLAVTGDVDHEYVVNLVKSAFVKFEAKKVSTYEPAVFKGGDRRLFRPLEQLHLTLGFPACSFTDDDYYALQVYSMILGGGMSSRLFQEIRENRGLAYSVYSFAASHADSGMLGIYTGTSTELGGPVMPVIADEMKKLTDGPKEAELSRARTQLKAGLLMSLESTSSRAEQIGRQMLIFGRVIPMEELVASVDAVDFDAVRRVAENVLEGPMALASVGEATTMPNEDKAQAMFR